jgi:hypothetical protein
MFDLPTIKAASKFTYKAFKLVESAERLEEVRTKWEKNGRSIYTCGTSRDGSGQRLGVRWVRCRVRAEEEARMS